MGRPHLPFLTCLLTITLPLASAQAQEQDPSPPATCAVCAASLHLGMYARTTADTGRRVAIEYSDAYAVRLAIHRIASYAEIPLFATEYLLGEKLRRDRRTGTAGGGEEGESEGGAHGAVAAGLGVLFAVNTVTGAWNLYDSRKEPAGRTRKWLHTLSMLAADAGFLLTAAAADDAGESNGGINRHRNLAIGSMSISTASTIMMWLWKD